MTTVPEFPSDLADWPDPEQLIRAVLLDLDVDGLTVGTENPPDPNGAYEWLPFLRVQCFGGTDLDRATEVFRFDVDAFAATKDAARLLAGNARQRLLNYPITTDVGTLDRVTTSSRPAEVPYGNPMQVRRYTAAYAGRTRR